MRILVVLFLAVGVPVAGCGRGASTSRGPAGPDAGDRKGSAVEFPEVPEVPAADPEGEAKARELIGLLGGDDFGKRAEAVDELTALGKDAVRPLVLALRHENKFVRCNAAHVLTVLADDAESAPRVRRLAVETLLAALKDPDGHCRLSVITALAALNDDRAVGPLIERMATTDSRTRDASVAALQVLTGEDFGDDAEAWRKWHEGRK